MTDGLHRALSGQRILVVENDRLIALDVKDILERWGCTVVGPTATAAAAIGLIEEGLPGRRHSGGPPRRRDPGAGRPRAASPTGRPFLGLTAYRREHLIGALRDAPLLRWPVDPNKPGQELSAVLQDTGAR